MYLRCLFFLFLFFFNHWVRYYGNDLSVIHLELVNRSRLVGLA